MVTPPMDLITSQDQELPHVGGHEMAELLAGIESEPHSLLAGSDTVPPHVEGFPHPHQQQQQHPQHPHIPPPPPPPPHQAVISGPPPS